jgi:glycosyltransferase involved in cell wall biosynthesis
MADTVDVVIPARNESENIQDVLLPLLAHPAIGKVIVVVDMDTADDTAVIAVRTIGDMRNGWVLTPKVRGKGQLVRVGLHEVRTPSVLFCDADIQGLTQDHISLLVSNAILETDYLTIGIPDIPANYPESRSWAWPWCSGERCVPTSLVRILWLHGYLMETQINAAARHANLPVQFEWLTGLKSAYHITEKRLHAMEEDAEWGRKAGILP